MTLFVSISLDSPVLETSVERASTVDVTLEQQTPSEDGSLDLTIWASGDGLGGFEDGLDADETVSRWVHIGGTETSKLYRTRLTERASSSIDYHGWADGKAVFLSAERDAARWTVEGYFPDRSVLRDLAAGCESNGVTFDLLEVSDTDRLQDARQFDLSDVQLQTLLTALNRGYYSVPRQVTLEELAASLDVSHQAVSERLRRGVDSLLRSTVAARCEGDRDPADYREHPTDDVSSNGFEAEDTTLTRPIGLGPEAL
ncbi:helix-turn-helix domain-containing protein [Salinigranum sp. GCM10025319]|uniref:helix-turn-helix domain-containing protein n=1 Tax=Salinigranum sp. GCM10025319 TaxID=3252687 RepID=UPI0036193469